MRAAIVTESTARRLGCWNGVVPGDDATLVEPFESELLRAGFATDDTSAAVLIETASSVIARRRVLALRGLTRRGLMTAPRWSEALGDGDVEVRRETLQLFAHDAITTSALLEMVTSLLGDDDPLVVEGAAFALGEHLYPSAVEALCRVAAEHEDARCRESAIAALGAIGDEAGLATIIRSLEDKPPIRRRAIVALANFEGPDVELALDTASEDRDWQVRSAVAQLRDDEDAT